MGLEIQYQEGQTPLDEDEKEGLLIPSVTTRGELDEVEQRNIENALRWTIERRRKFTPGEILTEEFIRELHARMLGAVWRWAGTFRNSNKNLGVDKYQISIELRLIADVIIEKIFNRDVFTWGGKDLVQRSEFRAYYLNALRMADRGNYEPLIQFSRS